MNCRSSWPPWARCTAAPDECAVLRSTWKNRLCWLGLRWSVLHDRRPVFVWLENLATPAESGDGWWHLCCAVPAVCTDHAAIPAKEGLYGTLCGVFGWVSTLYTYGTVTCVWVWVWVVCCGSSTGHSNVWVEQVKLGGPISCVAHQPLLLCLTHYAFTSAGCFD
jgi:hypothetical protein